VSAATGLRRFARPPDARPVERCAMCGTPLGGRHGHVVDLEQRSLACACRACSLLFTAPGAGRGRWRAVPDGVYRDRPVGGDEWDALGVPVGTAFFFHNSALGRVVGCYPGPGGATESQLELAGWSRLAAAHPMVAALEPDVRALLVHRHPDGTVEGFVVPIDVCYALVGRVRLAWHGLDGGDEVRAALAAVLADLRDRARPWPAGGVR
jgi:hypothetical protein